MIRIAKYPPNIDEKEVQLTDMLNRYLYHVVEDTDKDMKLPWIKDGTFLIQDKETSDKIDMILSSFTFAIQCTQTEIGLVQEIAIWRSEFKKNIKIFLKD